jgi:serine/threonine protein kinase
MEAIALDQQALQDTRGGKKSSGSSKPSSSPSPSRKTGHSPTSSTTGGGNSLSPPATSPSTSPLTRARKLVLQTSPQFNAASPIEWNTKYDGPIQECFGFKQKLGEASLGAVYVSQVVKSGTNVALRIIKKDSSISVDDNRAIMTQLKELKKLSSPRIAAILGVFDADSEIWIASQYCPIGSLRSLLSNHLHTLSEEQIRPVLRSTLVGLNTLHLSNIAHGSVRLTNILVDSVADVKLCDYGLHNLVKSFSTQKTLPHLVSDLVQAPSFQGDIWGLGVALIEMSEGRSSVEANMDAPVLSNPAKHSEEFNDFVNRCLSATTANPPPTCEELLSHPFLKVNVSSQSLIDAIAIALASARSGHSDSEASSPSPARSRQEVDDLYSRRSPGSHSHTRQQSSNSEDETSAKVRIAIRPSSGSAESFNALTGSSEISDMDSSAEGPLKEASSRSSICDERSITEAPHRATEQTIALLQRLITERCESALDGASDETKAVIASFSQAVIKLTEETLHGAAKQL